jgi:hypothetical protein
MKIGNLEKIEKLMSSIKHCSLNLHQCLLGLLAPLGVKGKEFNEPH